MKKILLLTPFFFLTLSPLAYAQCEAVALPYSVDAEAATPPALPQCMSSNWESFASNQVFKTIPGPVAGFEGNVLGYNTVVNTDFGMDPSSQVMVTLYSRSLQLQPGMNYTVSYRYGNSGANQTIDNVYVSVVSGGINSTDVATHQNITGATPVNFTSQPFTVATTGEYYLVFSVATTGTQGFFYLDDILVQEAGVAGAETHGFTTLSAYPNPVKDVITLTGSTPITGVALYAATGQKVLSETVGNTTATLNLQGLAAGIYILDAQYEGRRETLKIVKE